MVECLRSFKIEKKVLEPLIFGFNSELTLLDKILSLVCDNAENNSTMTDALAVLLPNFQGKKGRIRCFAHILNLVVKVSIFWFLCSVSSLIITLPAGHLISVCSKAKYQGQQY